MTISFGHHDCFQQVFLAEMMGTMLLVYNVFATIDIPQAGGGALG
jgi:hypothetical protein